MELDMQKMTADLLSAERVFLDDPTQDSANSLKLHTWIVTQLQYEKSKRKLFFHKQKPFEHGERAGKHLAYLVHCEE